MLIASQNAASVNASVPGAVKAAARAAVVAPGRTDAPDTAVRAGGDAAAVTTDPADPSGAAGFGQLLAQHMRPGDPKSLALPGDTTARSGDGPPAGTDGLPPTTTDAPPSSAVGEPGGDAARIGFGAGVLQATFPTVPARTNGDDAAIGSGDAVHDDAPANDLAAQLALVSQWAALATPGSTPAVAASGGGDGLDVEGKLDTVRAAQQAPGLERPVSAAGIAPAPQAAVAPLIATTDATVVERNGRPGAPTAPIGTKPPAPTAAKGPSVVDLSEPAEGLTLAEPAFRATVAATVASDPVRRDAATATDRPSIAATGPGTTDPIAIHGQTETASLATAFVTQVAAHAAAAVMPTAAPTVAPTTAPTSMPASLSLHEPVGTPAWSHEVGQATLRLVASDLQQGASLRLNPEHLGPVDVQVRVDNGVAHLSFTAAHAETRQAIESSRTTLDQLFSDQGLKIGDCAVGDSSSRKGTDADAMQGNGSPRDSGRWSGTAKDGDASTTTVTTSIRKALGLVDTFA